MDKNSSQNRAQKDSESTLTFQEVSLWLISCFICKNLPYYEGRYYTAYPERCRMLDERDREMD